MTYEFALDKNRIWWLSACFTAIGLLVFVAGGLVGFAMHGGVGGGPAVSARIAGLPGASVSVGGAGGSTPAAAHAAAPAAASSTAASAPAPAAGSAAPAAGAPAESEAAAPAHKPGAPADKDLFAIQLGAFQDQGNAAKLFQDLKTRGYSAAAEKGPALSVLTFKDSHQRLLHAVRIGPYKDLQSAARAALDINNKEGLQGFVRPADSL